MKNSLTYNSGTIRLRKNLSSEGQLEKIYYSMKLKVVLGMLLEWVNW